MLVDILAIIVLIITSQLWIPLAFLLGFLKLIFTFSLSAAWIAFKSLPILIWDFVHELF
jgi:hypothetical protein